MVAFKNATTEPLELQVRYLSREQGELRWRSLPAMTIPAGQTAGPLNPQGMRVRASEIRFKAKGESRFFNKHANDSLALVEEGDAGRIYAAEKIGQFVYIFQPKDSEDRR